MRRVQAQEANGARVAACGVAGFETCARCLRAGPLVNARSMIAWSPLCLDELPELLGELGYIGGIEAVPLAAIATAVHKEDPRPVITVCRSGGRSAQAVRVLHDLGVERVASVRGGMSAWTRADLPVRR